MRNHFLLVLAIFVSCNLLAQSPKYEFRAAWLATVSNIDWPNIKHTAAEQQQALVELRLLLFPQDGVELCMHDGHPLFPTFKRFKVIHPYIYIRYHGTIGGQSYRRFATSGYLHRGIWK